MFVKGRPSPAAGAYRTPARRDETAEGALAHETRRKKKTKKTRERVTLIRQREGENERERWLSVISHAEEMGQSNKMGPKWIFPYPHISKITQMSYCFAI